MASFYRASVGEFLSLSDEQILARLAVSYANRGYTSQYSDQTLTWERDIRSIRSSLEVCVVRLASALNWGVLLEFSIPRKEMRIDAVLLIGNEIVVLEAKSGDALQQAKRQIEEYALLLHYFHKASADRRIVPVIVSPEADDPDLDELNQYELFPQLALYWVIKSFKALGGSCLTFFVRWLTSLILKSLPNCGMTALISQCPASSKQHWL